MYVDQDLIFDVFGMEMTYFLGLDNPMIPPYICKDKEKDKNLNYLPVQISTNTIEYFSAVLVLFPLGCVETQHCFIHQISTTLKLQKYIFSY